MVLRLAPGVSNVGILGLMTRKMIKVAMPKKMRTRLNMKQRIAQHHTNGFVRRGSLRITGGFLDFLERKSGVCRGVE